MGYVFSDGTSYVGQWSCDEKSGSGLERWVDGSEYKGQFVHGARHGVGKYMSGAGELIYEGEFRKGKMDGEGIYHYANGRVYAGQWSQSQMNGHGKMTWPDGSVYSGNFC